MLDSDLASTYQVSPSALNQAVNRNKERFTNEFSFQLSKSEWNTLRSQIVILNTGRGQHRKYLPRVFTEHGAIMLATVLNSLRAIEASKDIVRAFVSLRHRHESCGTYGSNREYIYQLAEEILAGRDRLKLAEECIDLIKPKTPIGAISKINGRPRNKIVAAYPRSDRLTIEIPTEYRHLFNYLQMTNQTSLLDGE